MQRIWLRLIILILVLVTTIPQPIFSEAKKGKTPFAKVDRAKIEEAVKKGADWLIQRGRFGPVVSPAQNLTTEEFVLYTFIYAGVPRNSSAFENLLQKVLNKPLESTYAVSLLAMVLESLDSVKYQDKIAECAQFLVDNQCQNGQWSYGEPVPPRTTAPTSVSPAEDSTKKSGLTKAIKIIQIKKRRQGPAAGDNSNTQYACLGLRACMQAKVIIPDKVLKLTKKWLESNQNGDGGWDYSYQGKHGGIGHVRTPGSYGSMSAGALGSLIICDFYLNKRKSTKYITANRKIKRGLEWIIKNFTVEQNPKADPSEVWHYYWLYAIERLGAFLETETFGPHEWYPKGVEYLLAHQETNGSWKNEVKDTCFAILFLKRATSPLIRIISK